MSRKSIIEIVKHSKYQRERKELYRMYVTWFVELPLL